MKDNYILNNSNNFKNKGNSKLNSNSIFTSSKVLLNNSNKSKNKGNAKLNSIQFSPQDFQKVIAD